MSRNSRFATKARIRAAHNPDLGPWKRRDHRHIHGDQRGVAEAAGDQTLNEVRTMEQLVSESLARQRLLLLRFAIFSGLALLLACAGLYSVITYLTNERVPEFGVRMALGADSADVVRLVLRESLLVILAGIGIGLLSSIASGRVLERLEPVAQTSLSSILAGIVPALIAVALGASYIPARRAARVDPMVALRWE